MNLLKTYSKKEVLMVVAEHAGSNLPSDSKGVLTAKFLKDGSVEVFFIKEEDPKMLS
jgi:predicted nucleotide-binding protein